MSVNSPDLETSVRRQLEDRYVVFADPALRSRYLERSEGHSRGTGASAASILLRIWPVVKRWPIVGPVTFPRPHGQPALRKTPRKKDPCPDIQV